MSLARRLGEVEDTLSPQEAMLCWMREAHQFGSCESYARWLIDQPDDVYPLMRMPAQVVGAVRARNKGVPDLKLRNQFYRAQKDVLFLYYLHNQANIRALVDHEAIQLRVIILIKEVRALINEKHGLDQMRLGRIDLEGTHHTSPQKAEQGTRALYQEHLDTWLPEADQIRTRILEFVAAAEILSRRFFASEDILFPATRENLDWNLGTIANLNEIYADSLLADSPESDDDFRDYALALVKERRKVEKGGSACAPLKKHAPDVTCEARLLAEQWILMARSETLDKMGEHREAESLAEKLVRSIW